jgi:hypothetical protein
LCFFDLFTLSSDCHSISAGDGAGRLKFGHLLDSHQTHSAGSLKGEIGVVTERGNIETFIAAHVDQTCTFRYLEGLTVDAYVD